MKTGIGTDSFEHLLEHVGSQSPGLRIVAAAVIAVIQRQTAVFPAIGRFPVRQLMNRAVAERVSFRPDAERHEDSLMGDCSQSEQRKTAVRYEIVYLGREITIALAHLLWLGPVFRGKAFHRIGDPAPRELQVIVCGSGTRVTGEAKSMKCTVKQDTGKITGKRPAGAICPVHAGGEPDNEKLGRLIAKGRHRAGMITGIQDFNFVQKSGQPGTLTATS